MPSGRTHDRITLWSLPFVAGLTFGLTWSGNLTLLVLSGFFFGGLMFGPDLDIRSRQYARWGWLRWIWIPYQKMLRHRSIFSHGPIVGTTLRVIYLTGWLSLLGLLTFSAAQQLWGAKWNGQIVAATISRSLFSHPDEELALCVGLELGAMSHSLSDWSDSAYKRFKKGGLQAVMPQQVAKAKRKRKQNRRVHGQPRLQKGTVKPQTKRP